jgi:hypothetical protein
VVVVLRRALVLLQLLAHQKLVALLLEQQLLALLLLLLLLQEVEILAALLLLLELILVEQLGPGAARRPGLLEVGPPVVLDLVVRPPRQAPRDRRPPARVATTSTGLGAAHQFVTISDPTRRRNERERDREQ